MSEYEVETTGAVSSDFNFVQTSTMKKGSHIVMKDQPCKVDSVSTSKPGKHGSAKCHIVALNIFTGKKLEEVSPAHSTIKSPIVKREEFDLLDINDGFLELLDSKNDEKNDIREPAPEGDFGKKIKELRDKDKSIIVTVLSAMGTEMIIEVKEDTGKGAH